MYVHACTRVPPNTMLGTKLSILLPSLCITWNFSSQARGSSSQFLLHKGGLAGFLKEPFSRWRKTQTPLFQTDTNKNGSKT